MKPILLILMFVGFLFVVNSSMANDQDVNVLAAGIGAMLAVIRRRTRTNCRTAAV